MMHSLGKTWLTDFRVIAEPGFWICLVLVGASGAGFFALAGWAMMRV